MQTWIALFRGINVAGSKLLPMKDLVELLRAEGLADIRTYIQSGNVVFRSASQDAKSLGERIGAAVHAAKGFRPPVLVLSALELERAARENPFHAVVTDPRTLHLFFLFCQPRPADVTALERLKAGREAFELREKVFYLYTPDGFGRSKLAQSAERYLQTEATARNWNTVQRLIELAR
jgi:uncharacterized protein (DUF1697 family)